MGVWLIILPTYPQTPTAPNRLDTCVYVYTIQAARRKTKGEFSCHGHVSLNGGRSSDCAIRSGADRLWRRLADGRQKNNWTNSPSISVIVDRFDDQIG